jgi:hypothetical protein
VAMVVASVVARDARAQQLPGTFTFTEPAGTLVMPFDSTSGKASFSMVSRIGSAQGRSVVATHWSYWAADCKHLADVLICLTPNDTVVVDPTALQSERQANDPPANLKVGPLINLAGNRGMVTVTAFAADIGPSGDECRVLDPRATLEDVLVGTWTIADLASNSAFGNDAIGLSSAGNLPDASILAAGGLRIATYNPQTLTDSEVIVLPVKFPGGSGIYQDSEIGPLTSTFTCDNAFIDNMEIATSLPDLKIKCASFNPISSALAGKGEVPIIPPTVEVVSSGMIHLTNCRTSSRALRSGEFVFAFHGQAVGPFGTVVTAKYTKLTID